MNELEKAIDISLQKNGESQYANKAYLEFIKANFIIPIEKQRQENEEPRVLYLVDNSWSFLPVFTNQNYFDAWAEPIKNDIQILKLSGVNLLKGLGENTYVSLNPGSTHYKEFNPSELARMRSMILKLFGNN
ncbi:MAG: SseB family protein [Gammaproteobacteria bacterium]